MFFYHITDDPAGRRTAQRLLALRAQLSREGVPPKGFDTLLLATWNIREFDSPAYGERLPEALYYIAEIVSHFDLVAIQEVREDLSALDKLKQLLGNWWHYITTDVTEGKRGNRERMAFLYDTRKVRFGGLAGEIVIPPIEKKQTNGGKISYHPAQQLYRTPFICGFQAGWAKFMLCTVHILYGQDAAENPARIEEIRLVAEFLSKRAKGTTAWSNNLILLGDFNIYAPGDTTLKALTDAGFEIPDDLQALPPTNTGRKKRHYDQIAFTPRRDHFETTGRAGVFNYYASVFTDSEEDLVTYQANMGSAFHKTRAGKPRSAQSKRTYYRVYWRTHQMSDHLPMWVELKIDFGEDYLRRKAGV